MLINLEHITIFSVFVLPIDCKLILLYFGFCIYIVKLGGAEADAYSPWANMHSLFSFSVSRIRECYGNELFVNVNTTKIKNIQSINDDLR